MLATGDVEPALRARACSPTAAHSAAPLICATASATCASTASSSRTRICQRRSMPMSFPMPFILAGPTSTTGGIWLTTRPTRRRERCVGLAWSSPRSLASTISPTGKARLWSSTSSSSLFGVLDYAAHDHDDHVPGRFCRTSRGRSPTPDRKGTGRSPITPWSLPPVELMPPTLCPASPQPAAAPQSSTDNRHDGDHAWPETICSSPGMRQPLPSHRKRAPRCELEHLRWPLGLGPFPLVGSNSARPAAPKAPGQQGRYEHPWCFDYAVGADLAHPHAGNRRCRAAGDPLASRPPCPANPAQAMVTRCGGGTTQWLSAPVSAVGSTACRLAEQGWRVCVLERGRRFAPDDFIERPDQAAELFWHHSLNPSGIFELRLMSDVAVLCAAGVGGGSLIYANVQLRAPEDVFDQGWPQAITRAALDPYYERAESVLEAESDPDRAPPAQGHELRGCGP